MKALAWYHGLVDTIGLWPTIGLAVLGVICAILLVRTLLNAAISRAQRYALVLILSALGVPSVGATVGVPLVLAALDAIRAGAS